MSEQQKIRIVVEPELMENMKLSEVDALKKSLTSFIDAGFITPTVNNEIIIDRDFLIMISNGSERIAKARDKFGTDDNGFVLYQF